MKKIDHFFDLIIIIAFIILILVNSLQKNFFVLWGFLLWILILLATSWIHELGHGIFLYFHKIPIKKLFLGSGPAIGNLLNLIEIRALPIMAGVDFDLDEKFDALKRKEKIFIFISGSLLNVIVGLFFIIPFFYSFGCFLKDTLVYLGSDGNPSFLSLIVLPVNLLNKAPNRFLGFVGWFFIIAGILNSLPIIGLDGYWVLSSGDYNSLKSLKAVEQKSSTSIKIINLVSKLIIIIILFLSK